MNENINLIKIILKKIINFQNNYNVDYLYDELEKIEIQKFDMNGNIALFKYNQELREFDPSFSLNVEARVSDISGNPLHAIIYLDSQGHLLALEVFPWDKWNNCIDIDTLRPVIYNDNGLSNP